MPATPHAGVQTVGKVVSLTGDVLSAEGIMTPSDSAVEAAGEVAASLAGSAAAMSFVTGVASSSLCASVAVGALFSE